MIIFVNLHAGIIVSPIVFLSVDDLDIAVDFFQYFTATRRILEKDPSLWCVSAWNDNGKGNFIDSSKPGIGPCLSVCPTVVYLSV